jgi:dephospho-CoA kinase
MIVGLTGFYCSGKSTAERYLKEDFGFYVIDMDKIGHKAHTLPEVKSEIARQFGADVLTDSGDVDRKRLGALVFSDKTQLEKLNILMRPFLLQLLDEELQAHKGENIVISAALLFDAGLDAYCEKVFVVRAALWRLFVRGWKRDRHSPLRTWRTLRSQKLKEFINQRAKTVDIVCIDTNGTPSKLKTKLLKVLENEGIKR